MQMLLLKSHRGLQRRLYLLSSQKRIVGSRLASVLQDLSRSIVYYQRKDSLLTQRASMRYRMSRTLKSIRLGPVQTCLSTIGSPTETSTSRKGRITSIENEIMVLSTALSDTEHALHFHPSGSHCEPRRFIKITDSPPRCTSLRYTSLVLW